jgi:hypothetical protein
MINPLLLGVFDSSAHNLCNVDGVDVGENLSLDHLAIMRHAAFIVWNLVLVR